MAVVRVCCPFLRNPTAAGASASLSFNVSTDCVGDFVGVTACSNECGPGTRTKTFQIVSMFLVCRQPDTSASHGGRHLRCTINRPTSDCCVLSCVLQTTPAAAGGQECAFSDGQVVTEDCTGPVVCDVNATCTNATAPPDFGCVCNAGLEGNGLPGNCTTAGMGLG